MSEEATPTSPPSGDARWAEFIRLLRANAVAGLNSRQIIDLTANLAEIAGEVKP